MAKEARKNRKIGRKLTISIILTAFIISLGSCVAGYIQYDNTMRKLYNDNGYVIGEIILNELDHEKIARYAETWEEDDYYPVMEEYLESVRLASGAAYIYIAIPNGKVEGNGAGEGTMRYIYDCTGMKIGDTDPVPRFYEEFESTYLTGEKTGNYYVRHSPKYGYLTSCMLPVNDANGKTAAILFVDVFMDIIVSTLMGYIFNVAIITLVLVALICIAYWKFMKNSVVRPIKLIGENTREFAENDVKITDSINEVKTGDELQELAESVLSMEHSIVSYIENIKTITAEKERIGAELDVAAHIQASMLPCIFPAFPDRSEFEIYATMDPAKEVGGDFYDFFMVDERHLAIVVADVSDKGVPAALFMVIGKTLIKDHTVPGADLGDVFTEVNELLCQSNSEGLFITAFEGVLDLVTGEFNFVNAGHEMPYFYRDGKGFEPFKTKSGFVLAGMDGIKYRGGSITLNEGDKIFQYTDGITEATDSNFELYGMDRLTAILNENKDNGPFDILPAIKSDIDKFVGDAPQFDDITMLCLEFKAKMEVNDI